MLVVWGELLREDRGRMPMRSEANLRTADGEEVVDFVLERYITINTGSTLALKSLRPGATRRRRRGVAGGRGPSRAARAETRMRVRDPPNPPTRKRVGKGLPIGVLTL